MYWPSMIPKVTPAPTVYPPPVDVSGAVTVGLVLVAIAVVVLMLGMLGWATGGDR